MRDHDLRGLQFVKPDGTSFLRFHRPDLFADDIAADRPMLRAALDTGEPAQAFENGRVYPGYNFAFPVYEDTGTGRRLIGLVDYSVSFDAIRHLLQEAGEPHEVASRFILRRDLFDRVGHPSAQALYRPTSLHPDFVMEDDASASRDTKPEPPLPPWADTLEQQLAQDGLVQQAIGVGIPQRRSPAPRRRPATRSPCSLSSTAPGGRPASSPPTARPRRSSPHATA